MSWKERTDSTVRLDYTDVVAVRERAVLLALESGDETWIPLSTIPPGFAPGEPGEGAGFVYVSAWFAEREGLV